MSNCPTTGVPTRHCTCVKCALVHEALEAPPIPRGDSLAAGLAMLGNGEAFRHNKGAARCIVLYPEEAMAVLAYIEQLKKPSAQVVPTDPEPPAVVCNCGAAYLANGQQDLRINEFSHPSDCPAFKRMVVDEKRKFVRYEYPNAVDILPSGKIPYGTV